MAFDFPNSPTNGQVFTPSGGPTYTWDSAGNKWTVSPISATVTITTGTYTPTVTAVANIDATTVYVAHYIRTGNFVLVVGRIDVDATAASATSRLGISLPIASDIGAATGDLGGLFSSELNTGGVINGDPTNNRAEVEWSSAVAVNTGGAYAFTYRVI